MSTPGPAEMTSPRMKHLQREVENLKIQLLYLRQENRDLKKSKAEYASHLAQHTTDIEALYHDIQDMRDLFYRWIGSIPTGPLRPSPLSQETGPSSRQPARQATGKAPPLITRHVLGEHAQTWVHEAAIRHCINTGEHGTIALFSPTRLREFIEACQLRPTKDGIYRILDESRLITLYEDQKLGDYEIAIISTNWSTGQNEEVSKLLAGT